MLATYYHTLKHLKPTQVLDRAYRQLYVPKPDLRPPPSIRHGNAGWHTNRWRTPSMLGPTRFSYLNHTRDALFPKDWRTSDVDRLWLYNLHYFDDLNAIDSTDRAAWHESLLSRWVQENPPAKGPGWDPYCTSLRLVNWIKWQLRDGSLPEKCLHSLAVQARWLSKRVERHLLGNHLFKNAVALIFAGVFFRGHEAEQWLKLGRKLVARQLSEQVLPDGGHFELSPMYHSIFVEDLLDLINLSQEYPGVLDDSEACEWRRQASGMLDWLKVMCHPDGNIAFFNDAALGIAPSLADLATYAGSLAVDVSADLPADNGVHHLPNSGYVRVQESDAVALLDVARIGPDFLPGHAHADTLSFELSLFGKRVIVNSGTSKYGDGDAIRLHERGTAAHSTVEVNGESSSEVWGSFRVARRGYPTGLQVHDEPDGIFVTCAHNGYKRLNGKPVHKREWSLTSSSLTVRDHIDGSFDTAIAFFHFHPSMELRSLNERSWQIVADKDRVVVDVTNGNAKIIPSHYAPEFGLRQDTSCLAVTLADGNAEVRLAW